MWETVRSSFYRTNQFAVRDRFVGIEERCRIFNNDEVADALLARYNEVQSWTSKWKFETLDFLLQLSESPADKTKIQDLAAFERPLVPGSLRWADLLDEDPFDNSDGLWNDVDFATASLEDDDDSLFIHEISRSDRASLDPSNPLDLEVTPLATNAIEDSEGLEALLENRNGFVTACSTDLIITETQLVKESLFMIHGLPTTVFEEAENKIVRPRAKFTVRDVGKQTSFEVLSKICEIGTKLNLFRSWISRNEAVPILQALQSALGLGFQQVDQELSQIQQRMIDADGPAVTLIVLYEEVRSITRNLFLLENILSSQNKEHEETCILILGDLFKLIRTQQALGDQHGYFYTATIFFECFQAYLRPLRIWIEEGIIREQDQAFFVGRSPGDFPRSSMWSKQYYLKNDSRGLLLAPPFLYLSAPKILAAGKAVVFLKALGEPLPFGQDIKEPPMDFVSVCHSNADTLSPFEDLFTLSFEQWIDSKRSLASSYLMDRIRSRFNLWGTFNALAHIFFSKRGAVTQQFAHTIFDKIDKGKRWQNRLAVTDLLCDVFSALSFVDTAKLSARTNETSGSKNAGHRSIQKLEGLQIHYELPWPIATIIKPETMPIYQQIFVLLLQLLRAKYVLDRLAIRLDLSKDAKTTRGCILRLRHRFRWFVDTMQNYLLNEVLEPIMSRNQSQMQESNDLDALIATHAISITELEALCLISDQHASTHQALISILELVIVFSDLVSGISSSRNAINDHVFQIDDSDSSDDDERIDKTSLKASESSESIETRLDNISTTYTRLLYFVFTGTREVSRSRAGSTLQILVDNLRFEIDER